MKIELAPLAQRGSIFALVLLASAGILQSASALAQGAGQRQAAQQPSFFESIGNWFDRQVNGINSYFRDSRRRIESFGNEAGVAARRTVDTAKYAADAIARVPNTRVVAGHERCAIAPNGAPDCVAAANKICKGKGFSSGSSMDMTTAEVCPAHVYLAGHNSGPECHTETFVSRALCQ